MSIEYISCNNLPASQLLKLVKNEAKKLRRSNQKDRNHKYYLNLVSKKIGYESYDQLFLKFKQEIRQWQNTGKDHCECREPDPTRRYYFVTMHESFEYSSYSHWIGWDDDGYELRAPSQINPAWFIKFIRESLQKPLYIIHDLDEAFRWMWHWQGYALIDHETITGTIHSFLQPSRSHSHARLKE